MLIFSCLIILSQKRLKAILDIRTPVADGNAQTVLTVGKYCFSASVKISGMGIVLFPALDFGDGLISAVFPFVMRFLLTVIVFLSKSISFFVSASASMYTFTPRPLMDGGFYTMTDDLASLLAAAHRNIGTLEGTLLPLKDNESLTELMMLKESRFNKMIDYPNLDLNSVLLNRGLGKSDDEINNISSRFRCNRR